MMKVFNVGFAVLSDLPRDQRIQRRLREHILMGIFHRYILYEFYALVSEVVNLLPHRLTLCVPTAFLTNDDQQ